MRPTMKHRKDCVRQRGAALIVGLIMLLLLTLIGVAGMKDTLLQQKMVANAKDRDVALQAAEAALQAAENSLRLPLAELPMAGPGLYDLTNGSVKAGFDSQRISKGSEAAFWQEWDWASNSRTYSLSLNGVADGHSPQYVVEKLPIGGMAVDPPGGGPGSGGGGGSSSNNVDCESLDMSTCVDIGGGAAGVVIDYRITARAVGSTTNAVVLLQSTLRRFEQASGTP